ncbi:MAG: sigma-54-dependent Fis family transcriptional regulator [Deltaproteobacteria bacterium]|nr:sigma-54-dependent Fis family transcriptional regulator [Deltaproteobacteria bacterium]
MSQKPPARPHVLLIDDDASLREVMSFHLQEEGYEPDVAPDGEQGLKRFDPAIHPVVVTDLKMPRVSGMDVLRGIKRRSPDTLVIVITAFGDLSTAIDAMKAGAFDFLPKPCDRDHFKLTVRKAMEHASLRAQVRELHGKLDSAGKELIFRSPLMQKVIAVADRVARSEGTVLILGESGTGKELLARRIHRNSDRHAAPFVAINCAAIPRDLLESELFGHVRGAFTGATRDRKGRFEQAHGGTLFLDEIADVPLDLQPSLLRVLQERVVQPVGKDTTVAVDVRVVAATNRDLRKAVDTGAFREDLYFRLAVIPIDLPALRERREDIAPLVDHFLARHGADRKLVASEALMRRLEAHEWRGNVRELENFCQRMALLAEDDLLGEEWAPASEVQPSGASSRAAIQLPPEGISLVDLERDVIVRALEMNHYNQSQTAKFLRIPRHILLYRIEKFQIPLKERS